MYFYYDYLSRYKICLMKFISSNTLGINTTMIFECEDVGQLYKWEYQIQENISNTEAKRKQLSENAKYALNDNFDEMQIRISSILKYERLMMLMLKQVRVRIREIAPLRIAESPKHLKKYNKANIERLFWRSKIKEALPKMINLFEKELQQIRRTSTYKSGQTNKLDLCYAEIERKLSMHPGS